MEKRKFINAMQVLQEVSVIFPRTKNIIDKKLEQQCSKENIYEEEEIYFALLCLYIGNEKFVLNSKTICFQIYFDLRFAKLSNKEGYKVKSLEAQNQHSKHF